jgi:hypothetical protein
MNKADSEFRETANMPTTRRTWKSGTTRRTTGKLANTWYGTTTSTKYWPTTSYSPNKYATYRKELQAKIGSYRTLHQQCTGTGKVTAFSPTGANKWINYVDQGACIYKWNHTQFCRTFGFHSANVTPTYVYRYLRQKYGSGVKAVTRGKGNCWLVAATPKITARPFYNYNWK